MIGLFGTCGDSKWRDMFIKAYLEKKIEFFNPVKSDWCPEDAKNEANHLNTDDILLLCITGETVGTTSLAEIGFAILSVQNTKRHLIIYIEPELTKQCESVSTKNEIIGSNGARKIILEHLKHIKISNVYVVHSLEEMLILSIKLYPQFRF